MARNPGPVRPLHKHDRLYEKDLRREILQPLFRDLRAGMADAVAIAQVYQAMDAAVEAAVVRGVPIEMVRNALERINTYHKARLIKSFNTALGIDIKHLLTDTQINMFMTRKIRENVDLIKTIPRRMHDGLSKRLQDELREAPFNRKRITGLIREEYKSTGYNLRRLARDQTTKTIGGLTEIRQRQMSIEGYQWNTSNDDRVRETHVSNDGLFFRWDSPPVETGHPGADIMCRCVALPVVSLRDRERLGATK